MHTKTIIDIKDKGRTFGVDFDAEGNPVPPLHVKGADLRKGEITFGLSDMKDEGSGTRLNAMLWQIEGSGNSRYSVICDAVSYAMKWDIGARKYQLSMDNTAAQRLLKAGFDRRVPQCFHVSPQELGKAEPVDVSALQEQLRKAQAEKDTLAYQIEVLMKENARLIEENNAAKRTIFKLETQAHEAKEGAAFLLNGKAAADTENAQLKDEKATAQDTIAELRAQIAEITEDKRAAADTITDLKAQVEALTPDAPLPPDEKTDELKSRYGRLTGFGKSKKNP